MSPAELNALLLTRSESEHVEFKEAKNRFDFEELVAYCVALANEGGGKMVMGVTDTPPRRVVGTRAFDVPERTVTGIHERIQMKVDWTEIAHPDGRVLVFDVPSRPQGQPIHYAGRYFMRAGSSLVPMSPDQLKRIFAEGQTEVMSRPARTGCEADDVIRLLDTQSCFDLLKLPYPATREAVLDRLEREKLIVRDGPHWTIANLGAVLFAKRLDEFEGLFRKVPRVVVYEGTGKLKSRPEVPRVKGYAGGFQGLIEFINSQIPANEVIGQALRQEVKMFPELAIRELVANALIHQDFTATGMSVMIEIYSDRMEISNPGRPGISPDRFIDEYQSRNERLADLMRRLGICEEKGTGIDKVVQATEAFQLAAPDFRVSDQRTTVVLFAHKEVEDMDRADRVRACYQHCCLRYVMNERMTNQSLRERFKLPENKSETVSRIIRETMEAGKIKLADAAATSLRYRSYLPFWA